MKHGWVRSMRLQGNSNIKSSQIRILLVVATTALLFSSCSQTTEEQLNRSSESSNVVEGSGELETVAIGDLKPGPIQRESLTVLQLERIENIRSSLSEIDTQSKEQWIENFKRDLDPDKELAVWERIAKAYTDFQDSKDLSRDAKSEAFKILLLRSMSSPEDVLSQVKLNQLTNEDARTLMQSYE